MRRHARVTLLAGAAVAALGFGGLNAAGASAEAACNGANITGGGSSLQRIAHQNVWIPQFESTVCTNPGEAPTVSYASTSSGAGLTSWNAPGGGSIDHSLGFIGTDQPPNATEITNVLKATAGTQLLVIPVAQTSIAIVANPPKGCALPKIKQDGLQRVLRGGKKEWSEISGTTGGAACNAPITRVVPSDSSGTTYQLKHFLSLVNGESLPCLTAPNDTWAALQASSLNTTWPQACKGHKGLSAVKRSLAGGTGPAAGVGGVDEVKTVNATTGSIGFAALPDAEAAKAGGTVVVQVQNGTDAKGKVTYAAPGTATGAQANCAGSTYVVPTEARFGEGTGFNADWSGTYGSALSSSTYPICTLTWDLAFVNYPLAGFAPGVGTTVKDYLYWYMFEGTGQLDLESSGRWYSNIPGAGSAETNVLLAAFFSASQIES